MCCTCQRSANGVARLNHHRPDRHGRDDRHQEQGLEGAAGPRQREGGGVAGHQTDHGGQERRREGVPHDEPAERRRWTWRVPDARGVGPLAPSPFRASACPAPTLGTAPPHGVSSARRVPAHEGGARRGGHGAENGRLRRLRSGYCHEKVPLGTVEAINGNIRAVLRRGRATAITRICSSRCSGPIATRHRHAA